MSSFVETTEEEEENNNKKKGRTLMDKSQNIKYRKGHTDTHTQQKKKKDAPCGSEPGLVSSRVLSHKCIPT